MMRHETGVLIFLLFMLWSGSAGAIHGEENRDPEPKGPAEAEIHGKVGQVAGDAVYIDIGRLEGLDEGDTVHVRRDGVIIGKIVVTAIASQAASCRPLFPISGVQAGDPVVVHIRTVPLAEEKPVIPIAGTATAYAGSDNRVHGGITFGSLLSEDLTQSGLDFSQPSLGMRITVEQIAGEPLDLRIRHNTRYLGRETQLGGDTTKDRWTHKLSELFLTYGGKEALFRIRAGRLLPSSPRGIGYVDGGMIEYRTRPTLSFGLVGGTRPDLLDSAFRSDEPMFGLFTRYERKERNMGRRSISAAFVGRYRNGTVNREYFYLDGDYTSGGRFSSNGSIEIDVNRGWKHADRGRRFDFTSLYLSARYRLSEELSLNASYDTRRATRSLDNVSTPDSLFDDSLRRGLHSGAVWSPSGRVRISGDFGVRFQEGVENTYSASASARMRDFPLTGFHTSASLFMFRSLFTRGYRPAVNLNLPLIHGLRIDLRGGDTIYDLPGGTEHNPWIGSSFYRRLGRWNYVSFTHTQYLSDQLRSVQIFLETGVLF